MDINPTMTITSVLNGHTAIFIFVQTYDIFDSNVLNSYPNILKNVMTNSAGSNPSPERIKINNDQHFNSQSLLNQQLVLDSDSMFPICPGIHCIIIPIKIIS